MKLSNRLILPGAGLAVVGSIVTLSSIMPSAANAASTQDKPTSLVQEIADKFHLNKSDVQAVVDQHKNETQQYREQKYEDQLNQAVTDGTLTAAQKQAIISEHNKLKDEIKNSDQTNRKQTMDKVRQEASDWAKQNNIDEKWLMRSGHGHMNQPAGNSQNP